MGAGGSAMAVVAADCVIMSDNLMRLPSVVNLCRHARKAIIFNCLFSIVVKIIAIILAVLGK
jgi:Cd2+/Zn2+-exporting ATPase